MRPKTCECPNCGERVEDIGTLTLICYECGIQFNPGPTTDEGDDYYRYD